MATQTGSSSLRGNLRLQIIYRNWSLKCQKMTTVYHQLVPSMALSENEGYPNSDTSGGWSSFSLLKYGHLAGGYTSFSDNWMVLQCSIRNMFKKLELNLLNKKWWIKDHPTFGHTHHSCPRDRHVCSNHQPPSATPVKSRVRTASIEECGRWFYHQENRKKMSFNHQNLSLARFNQWI